MEIDGKILFENRLNNDKVKGISRINCQKHAKLTKLNDA